MIISRGVVFNNSTNIVTLYNESVSINELISESLTNSDNSNSGLVQILNLLESITNTDTNSLFIPVFTNDIVSETISSSSSSSYTVSYILLESILDTISNTDNHLIGIIFRENILDTLTKSDTLINYYLSVNNILTIADSVNSSTSYNIQYLYDKIIIETLKILDVNTLLTLFSKSIVEALSLDNSNPILLFDKIVDTISILENNILLKFYDAIVSNNISINSLLDSLYLFSEILNDNLSSIDSALINSDIIVNESFVAIHNIILNNILYQLIYSIISLSDNNLDISIFLTINSDVLKIDDYISNDALLKIIHEEGLILSIGKSESNNYTSYLLEPETFSTSTYSNYNFSQSTKFNNKYVFSNKEGLYEYGSEYDDGKIITARIQTAALDFGTSNLKQLPYFYIGVTNSNKLVLKLSVDGKASVYYKLNKKTEYLTNQKISIGKGLIGRYFQFELITEENTDFNMESIEFTPLVLRRKL